MLPVTLLALALIAQDAFAQKNCAVGEFYDKPTKRCVTNSDCPPGTVIDSRPTWKADRTCASCPTESFSDKVNSKVCKPAKVCFTGEVQLVAPTLTSDRVCVRAPTTATTRPPTSSLGCPTNACAPCAYFQECNSMADALNACNGVTDGPLYIVNVVSPLWLSTIHAFFRPVIP